MWEIFKSVGSIDKLKKKGSLQYYKKRLKEYQENEADLLIDMGILCYEEEKYDESIAYFKQAQLTYNKLDFKEGRAYVFDLIGDVYLSIREMDKALDNYKKSFELYASIKSPMKSDELQKIKEVEDIKEAIEMANKSEIFEEESKEDEPVVSKENVMCHLNYEKVGLKLEKILKLIKNMYGVNEISKEEYETGYIQKSIYDARNEGNHQKEMALFLLTGYYLMGEQKHYSALKSFKQAFHVALKSDDKKGEGFSLLLLGAVYYILGSKDKIYEVFKKSLHIFKQLEYEEGEANAIDLINTLYNEDTCSDDELLSQV